LIQRKYLAPKVPFKQHLDRTAYVINMNDTIGLTPSAYMRRMTSVSPYPHWHYFDTYEPARLKAVYRGNGIPLPIGNMRPIKDPCPHWSLFRAFKEASDQPRAQISVLRKGDKEIIYSCDSIRVVDLAGNTHVLCVGVDLNPALAAQGVDPQEIAGQLKQACMENGGKAPIPDSIRKELLRVARVLNIAWIERGLDTEVILICPRAGVCPRKEKCDEDKRCDDKTLTIRDIREEIIRLN